jgi:hypothetical protein
MYDLRLFTQRQTTLRRRHRTDEPWSRESLRPVRHFGDGRL